ncbi:immunoglobulin gamma-1 heavy chain-like isoform X2 [Anguilla anguilla]|uniref:immunoglobulin gamma-1 heavy chain-like isoform X2 n=1 Tax=Anguilla anguilla TaxID=7936 RepID=UPI0015A7984A|nr:immunoglobulin gamma-1 heavy chain-like isoform X2 [Anguilla anguilla]
MGAVVALAVLLGTLSYVRCVELTQPGSVVVKPGQSLTISCKLSGYSVTDSSYATHWIRQPAGKALEWIGRYYVDGGTNQYLYKDSLKSKFAISIDTSSNTVSLRGSSLQTGDTAVYYCARLQYNYFDYWGKGTQVTVSNTPPSLFPLMACGPKGSNHLTLACIARGFSPDASVTFRSTCGMAGTTSTQYRAVQISGSYASISLVSVKAEERESYSCSVNDSSLNEKMEVSFKKPDQTPCLEVTLNPPKMRELFENNQAVLDCVITGEERAAVQGASITWTPSGTDTSSNESQITQDGHVYRKTSTLTLGQERWFTEQNVQCSVQQISNKPTITKSFSRNTSGSKVPKVAIYTPSKEEDSEFVSLVCVVAGFSPWDVFVMWTVGNGPYEEGITSEPVESKTGTFSVTSLFNVSTAKWKSPSIVTCNVKHISVANGEAPITTSVSRSTETVSALNCNDEGEEEDELGSLWSTTSSFITLFLCTLIYSTLLSLIKMKK